MSGAKKKPPFKLVWFDAVTSWLAGLDEEGEHTGPLPDLRVTRSAMNQTVAMVLRATKSKTNEAMVAARWVERMTGVNQGKAAKAIGDLEKHGWLHWTQRRVNRVKIYRITLPRVLTHPQHYGSSADTSADTSADSFSDTPGTPGTPLETRRREERVLCSNCERTDGHDDDCPQRPFAAAELDGPAEVAS